MPVLLPTLTAAATKPLKTDTPGALSRLLHGLDRLPWTWLLVLAAGLAVAAFTPEPQLIEMLRMLAHGTLVRPLGNFDLVTHAAAPFIVALQLWRR